MTHSVASLGVGAFVGISVDEILSMCRRFFGYQRDIRVILYDLLVQIQIDFPACRGLVLRLLGNHMNNLISDEKFDLSWATSSSRAKKSSGSSLHPVISETEYVVLHPDKYVDMSSGSPQESLSDALISALMLVCPFRSGPKEMLLTTSQCRADNRRPASASQWDTVDVNFVKSQVAESLVFRCPSEIFLMYDANSFCSRRVCDDTESVQIRNNILKICKGITDNALTELRIPPRIPDSGATILDQHRIFSLLESFHVAMSCTIILPNVSFADCHGIDLTKEKSLKYLCAAASRPRLKLLNYLCTRADVVSALAVSIRKSSKNTGVWPSDPGTPHMSSPLMRFIERFNISSLGSMSAIFQDNTNHVRCPLDTHSGLHIFITEFQFLSEVLTMLNADDDDNDPTIESPVMQAETLIDCNIGAKPYEPPGIAVARVSDVLTKENLHFLENHVLERGVVAYECTLTLLTALMKCERFGDMNCFSTSTRNPTRSNGEQNSDNSGILWAWWGWFAMRAINIKMFSQLLTFFRRQRIRDRSVSAGRRGGVTGEPHCVFTNRQYSNLQLALRAMIGSIRLETAISHLISGHLSKSENIAGIFCARDVIPSSSGLVLLLESGFEGVMRRDAGTTYGSMLTQRFGLDGTQGFASTAYTQEGEAGADTQWIQVLQTHVKNFGKLFLAMHAMEAEKNECPGVVCVISELFDILSMVPAAQKDSADNFLRYCKEKLSQPNGNLCRNLIQFTILHAAADPADRLKRALQCSIMIKSAIKYSEDEQEEAEPDSDAEDDPLFASSSKSSSETCVLVSCSGAYQAASCVIQIMEKACNEIELLYKLARKANARYDKKSNVVYTWTQTNNNTVMNNPQELNTIICATLLRVVHVLEKLLQFELASISPKVLGVVVKVYKFLIKLSKEIATRVNKGVESASTCVIPMYRSLCSRVIDQFATRLSDYLMHVRNAEYSGAGDISNESEDEDNGRKQRKGKSAKIATVNQRLKKLVPDVIYQMEQLDVVFIRLSGALRGAEKVIVSKWIRRTAVCDFKLKADMIQKEQRRNESIELRNERSRNDKKRKQAHSEGSKNNKRQKRMDDDSIIGDESTELGLPYEGIAEEEYDDSMY